MDADDEAFGAVEDDEATMEPIQINFRYFNRNSTRRVGFTIEVAEIPSTSRWIIEVRPPSSNIDIILDDRVVADDEDASIEEGIEDIVEIRNSARSLGRHRRRMSVRQPARYFINRPPSPIIILDDDDRDVTVAEEENEDIMGIFSSTSNGAASPPPPPVSFVSSTDRHSALGRQRRRMNSRQPPPYFANRPSSPIIMSDDDSD